MEIKQIILGREVGSIWHAVEFPSVSTGERQQPSPGLMEATWPPSPAPVMSPGSEDRKSRVVSFSAAKADAPRCSYRGPVSKGSRDLTRRL